VVGYLPRRLCCR